MCRNYENVNDLFSFYQLIHEMCGLFGIGSVTAGDEPNQYVHATANSDSSRVPGISFEELEQCRNGHNIE